MNYTYQKPLVGERVGVVFGSFAPLHQGHLDLIMRAKKECDGGCIVVACGFDGDKGEPMMPHKLRYRYVREFFQDDDLVAVYAINDTELGLASYPNGWDGWMNAFDRIREIAVDGNPGLRWYVGDLEYYQDLCAMEEDAVLVDRVADNPICATMIRNDPIGNWDKITAPFRRAFSTNILICGTASEGKTTMTRDLGKYFNAPYSYEWAREYMEESCLSEWELDGADYMAFLEGQYRLNKKIINSPANHGVFFADTDSMVTRMYAEYYMKDKDLALTEEEFEKVAVLADEITSKCRWDKIFLVTPHGKFVDDHSRYMGHSELAVREEMYEILCNNIKRSGNWDKVVVLKGNYYENFLTVVEYVKGVMKNGKG